MFGPIWLRWLLTAAGIALAGAGLADLIGAGFARRRPAGGLRFGFSAAGRFAMPLGMAAMTSPVGDPLWTRNAALCLGVVTAGSGLAAGCAAGTTTAAAGDDWLAVGLSGVAMVLAAVAGHGTGTAVGLAAAVPPLSYPGVRTAVGSVRRLRTGSRLREGTDLAASAGMISMLLTML